MKIALFHNLPGGGALNATYEEAKYLSKYNQIDLFIMPTANKDFRDLSSFTNKTFTVDYSPLKKYKFPFSRLNWIIQLLDLICLEKAQKKLAKMINSQDYDLCWLTNCQFTEIPLIINYLKIPVVYFSHSTIYPRHIIELRPYSKSMFPLVKKIFPDFGQTIYARILKKRSSENIRKARLVLTSSYFMKKQLHQIYGINAEVNYLGIDIRKYCPKPAVSKENIVLSVGALEAWKGHDFIIESLSHITPAKRPHMVIASHIINDSEKQYLNDLAERLNVKLTIIKDADVVDLYNKAKVFCFAAHFEPFGLVPLESMACETPAVGIKEGGIQETILHKKTGILTEREPEKFAEAILFFLENEDAAKEYGRQGRKYVIENWNWEKSVSELEKKFYGVVSNKK